MEEIIYQVVDEFGDVWFESKSKAEATKRMKQIASEPHNDWYEFFVEKVVYETIYKERVN